ncbi:MAG: AraC family transcriptional regulator [Chthoniobacterales bacterium]|nr:AraC family transcriptional regulator [Chthoniobacterales bacterium]
MASHRKFHGTTLKAREVAGFALKEIRHPAGVFIPKHSHKNAHVGFILDGGFTETFTRKTLECRPLSVSYIAPGLPHTDDFRHGVHCLVFEISSARLAQIRDLAGLEEPVFVHGGRAAWLTLKMYSEALRSDAAAALTIEGLALEILAELGHVKAEPAEKKLPRWLNQARELLHARLGENMTHEEVADGVGVHPVYLATLFRRHFRCTIGEYVRRLRIEFAAGEIANSGRSLCEIGLAAGFSDQSHFSKVFKHHTGMTPGNFRANLPGRHRPPYLRRIQDISSTSCSRGRGEAPKQ